MNSLSITRLSLAALLMIGMVAQSDASPQATETPPPATDTQPATVDPAQQNSQTAEWGQWRGPNRDGTISDVTFPESLDDNNLKKAWSIPLEPSYSGPLVVGDRIFVTETQKRKDEVVTALDRKTGKVLWTADWPGSMKMPMFAAANGNWIRSTPTYSDGLLFVGGIRDVLVCLDANDGRQVWRYDFPADSGSNVPTFGCVSSPIADGKFLYVQAGGGFVKLNKFTGEQIWKSLDDGGGMFGSAFSSPVIDTISGKRQAVVLTRADMCGVDLETGSVLWKTPVPAFRGMNILTPSVYKDGVFTSTYGGTAQMLACEPTSDGTSFSVSSKWKIKSEGYMTSPVIVDGHAYYHLRNQRFACINLETGEEKWRSKPFGKYVSLVTNGKKIIGLDQSGKLMLMNANPEKFELLDNREVGTDSWAHVAVTKDNVVVRNLRDVTVYEWAK